MAATKPATRRKNRIRRKVLVADSTTAIDLTSYPPIINLGADGTGLWQTFVADPPYWWTGADLAMASMLCVATDAVAGAVADFDGTPAGRATIIKEWRSLAAELGMSPTSRSRLKLSEAQGVVAARRVEAMEDEHGRRDTTAIPVDELFDDA